MKKQKLLKLLGFSFLGLIAIAPVVATISCGSRSGTSGDERDKNEQNIPIESIALNETNLTLEVGKSGKLEVTINPSTATNQKVTWTSSNESIVTVDENGNVKALKVGNAEVTATTSNNISAKCNVNIVDFNIPVESIALDKTSIELVMGDFEQLIPTIKPSNATDKKITWSSSDENIVTVDENGKVIVIKANGNKLIVITATASNGKKAKCNVLVKEKEIPVTGVELSPDSLEMLVGDKKSIELEVEDSEKLTPIIKPSNATNQKVTWTSSDESTVTVDENGNVKALKVGNAEVTATTSNNKLATCNVSVVDSDDVDSNIPIESIALNETSLTLEIGESKQLIPTIKPSNATNQKVTWTSSDESTVTVDENGNVKALKVGNADVRVETQDGKYSVSCKIFVYDDSVLTNLCVLKANADSSFKFYQDAGNSNGKSPNLQYAQYIRGKEIKWQEVNINDEISIAKDSIILLRGKNKDGWGIYNETAKKWTQNGNILITGNVALSGKITALVDEGEFWAHYLPNRCFSSLFKDSTGIRSITSNFLPSPTLDAMCYNGLFSGCTSLENAPSLPATTLYVACYASMFKDCKALKVAPNLPATVLADGCYNSMFNGCTSLENAPSLPATTLKTSCYIAMFKDCKALKVAPDLPATTLVENCYKEIFSGCSSLQSISIGYTGSYNDLYFNSWTKDICLSGGTFYYNGEGSIASFRFPNSSWIKKSRTN